MTAQEILRATRSGQLPDASLLRRYAHEAADDRGKTAELFQDFVEPLSDSFDPDGPSLYSAVFSEMIEALAPDLKAAQLRERYARLGYVRLGIRPNQVFVLSRVTIGADIAVTSVLMDAAKRAFPDARVVFVGSRKNAELWAADRRVDFREAPYDRTGTLRGRIEAHRALIDLLAAPNSLVLDPDSRLTQLGLIPVCHDGNYLFFESRAYRPTSTQSLSQLAAEWVQEKLGVEARNYIAIPRDTSPPRVTVSFGVGENPAKRVSEAFEIFALQELVRQGCDVLVDQGAGGEEAERVQLAVDQTSGLPGQVKMFRGSFASFASHIAASPLYLGYDSAGQHAAAALGIPSITVFNGYPNQKFLERWRPTGPNANQVLMPSADLFERLSQGIRSVLHSALP